MTDEPTPMVRLAGVTKRWGSFTAVDDVTLSIRPGEFLTLLGPSGCGKTTMLRMISGFERPTGGRVQLDGQDVTDLPPYRRAVNQVFQSYALFPHLTVRQNIEFGPKTHKLAKADIKTRVDEAVQMVALEDFQNRRPGQLSGGQRQRVALARAIVNRPKVLLLDEPLSALDAKLRHEVQIELKRLQHRLGITFVFVTHDQDEALTMSDRIAVVHRGRIEQVGTAQEIYHRPATRFVATFVGKTNVLDGQVVAVDRATQTARMTTVSGQEVVVGNAAGSLVCGQTVAVSVRPEHVRVLAERPDGPNVLAATVEEQIFRGATGELILRAGRETLSALVSGLTAANLPARGAAVWCQVDPGDCVCIRTDGNPGARGLAK